MSAELGRVRLYAFAAPFLARVVTQGRSTTTVDGIPPAARVVSWHVDTERDLLVLVVEHESFEPVTYGGLIPRYDVTVMDNGHAG